MNSPLDAFATFQLLVDSPQQPGMIFSYIKLFI